MDARPLCQAGEPVLRDTSRKGRQIRALTAVLMCMAMAGSGPAAIASPDGAVIYKQRCQGCHSVTLGARAVIAPNLAGVVGRQSAATGYSYSPALRASRLVWTRQKLGVFLAGPQQLVPGTRMAVRIANPAERKAIVDFLARTGR